MDGGSKSSFNKLSVVLEPLSLQPLHQDDSRYRMTEVSRVGEAVLMHHERVKERLLSQAEDFFKDVLNSNKEAAKSSRDTSTARNISNDDTAMEMDEPLSVQHSTEKTRHRKSLVGHEDEDIITYAQADIPEAKLKKYEPAGYGTTEVFERFLDELESDEKILRKTLTNMQLLGPDGRLKGDLEMYNREMPRKRTRQPESDKPVPRRPSHSTRDPDRRPRGF